MLPDSSKMNNQNEHKVYYRITGTVQGVGYRKWTQRTAQDLGLKGWVMNQADNSVCVLLIGTPKAIKEMVSACWSGPPAARVAAIAETGEHKGEKEPAGDCFEIRF